MKNEEWRPITLPDKPDFVGKYEVSSIGNVRRVGAKRNLAFINHPQGYVRAQIYGKSKKAYPSVHRLVAYAFIPNPHNKPQVNHKNGIKNDNSVENLEWVTSKENIRHSVSVLGNKASHGEAHCHARFTESDIRWMRAWWKTGDVTQESIARMMGTRQASVWQIVNRKTWKHVA